jgi:GntR family transcriptional repressor for pyruvate dehydrogenase complex
MVRPSGHSSTVAEDLADIHVSMVSVSSEVSKRLEQLIGSGRFEDGARLPPERELAASLMVSRASVREAVHELWLKGLVERRRGRGTFVRSPEPARTEFLTALHGRLSDIDMTVFQIMDYRAAIEPPIAARAAERAGAQDWQLLSDLLEAMEGETAARRSAELDARFHYAIAQATRNPLFVQLVEFSSHWLESTREVTLQSKHRRELSLRGHREIVRAIAARDGGAAAAAMSAHIAVVSDSIRAMSERKAAADAAKRLSARVRGEGVRFDEVKE